MRCSWACREAFANTSMCSHPDAWRDEPCQSRPGGAVATTVLLLFVTLFGGGDVIAASRNVTIQADDGRTVTGTLFEANYPPAPAVVLVPALGHPRDEWQAIAQRFAD